MKTCNKCDTLKSDSEFHFRKDNKKFRPTCKICWQLMGSSRRLGITVEQAKEFYLEPKCLCCGEVFKSKREQNLHHVNHKVKGVVCMFCNIALRQETERDLQRIKSCIEFMSKPRKNLFDRENLQGSQPMETDPSTITRPAHRQCKFCNKCLPLSKFYRQKYKSGKYGYCTSCRECYKVYVRCKQYKLTFDEVSILRSVTNCDCCDSEFDHPPFIHHVDRVLGVVCHACNILLEQESDKTKHKLQSCLHWVMMT